MVRDLAADRPDREALAAAMGASTLPDDRGDLVEAVSAWTSRMDKDTVADMLQRAGVPAAPMNRAVDVLADPVLRAPEVVHRHGRIRCSTIRCPPRPVPSLYAHIPRAELRPAPMPGEHTREICQKLLSLDTEEIDRLIAEGVLFTSASPTQRGLAHDNTQDAGAGRLRTGQPARRGPERRADRPDGGGGARGRRSASAGGRRLRYESSTSCRGATATRAGCSRSASAPATPPPATPAWAAMCRRRWSTRRAWTSSRDAPTSSLIAGAETFRTRTRLRNRGVKPDWTSEDESVPFADGANERRAAGRAGGDPHQPRPCPVFLRHVRAGVADQRGGVRRTRTAGASANCGRSSARSQRTIRTPGAEKHCRPRRSGSRAPTTG